MCIGLYCFTSLLYVCIHVAPWSCESRHFVPPYVHTCSGMTIKLNLTCVIKFLDREEGGGNRRTFNHFNNKINKHKRKAAAPHGRLPHTKHKPTSRPGPLSSFTVVTPPFALPELLRGTRDRGVAQVSFIIFTPPVSLRSHGSRPRPTRHNLNLT